MPRRYQQDSFSWTLTYCSSCLHLCARDGQDATAKGKRLSACQFSASNTPVLQGECFLHSQETECCLLSPSPFPISVSSLSLSLSLTLCVLRMCAATEQYLQPHLSHSLWNFSNFAPRKRQRLRTKACLFLKPSPTLMFQITLFHSFSNNFQMY